MDPNRTTNDFFSPNIFYKQDNSWDQKGQNVGILKRAITLYLSYINIDGSNPIWPISPKRAETAETTYALIMSLILFQEIYNNK